MDAKEVFVSFIKNHNIKHTEADLAPSVEEGTWSNDVKTIASKAIVNAAKTQIDVLLNSFGNDEEWYTLKKTSSEQTIRNTIYTTSGKVNNLTDTFKNLVNGKDSFTSMTVAPSLDSSKKVLIFNITLTKNDNTTKTLKLILNLKHKLI